MEIKRTANAGILLQLDGVSILLDGVSDEVFPYLKTPDAVRESLLSSAPDVIVFTHQHKDHYDASFVSDYLKNTAGPILGPADIPMCDQSACRIGGVQIIPVNTRHLGKREPIGHNSYVITGSVCVWFMGDATPNAMMAMLSVHKPDVIVAPYAYATAGGWELIKKLQPKALVVVHMPDRQCDPYGLWALMESAVGSDRSVGVYAPDIGQRICFTR